MLALVIVIIPGGSPDNNKAGLRKLSNPAYDYCSGIMGYEYQVITQSDGGQNGMCKMPDGTTCSDWDFYSGKCGAEYSWCEQQGYNLVTRQDGKDPYSPEYAVCVDQKASMSARFPACLAWMTWLRMVLFSPSPHKKVMSLPWRQRNQTIRLPPALTGGPLTVKTGSHRSKTKHLVAPAGRFQRLRSQRRSRKSLPKTRRLNLDLSEQYLVSDCFVGGNCTGGIEGSTLEYIRDFGIPDEACYPYTGVDSSCSARCSDYASRLKFLPHADWSNSYNGSDIKYILSNYGPVTIALAANGANGGYFEGGTGIYRCTNDIGSGGAGGFNHSILAVGYDDAGGYWIAKNSWGSTWNGDGYFKLGYNECNSENSQISWTQSSLPITIDEFTYLPAIVKSVVPPGAFGKTAPANGAHVPSNYLILDWSDSAGATSYDLCYDLSVNGECTGGWAPIGSASQFNLSALLIPGWSFEWQVRANNSTGAITYADDGAVWSFIIDTP